MGVNSEAILFINSQNKQILSLYRYPEIESVVVLSHMNEENLITIKLRNQCSQDQPNQPAFRYITLESAQKDEIAALIYSYAPNLNVNQEKQEINVNNKLGNANRRHLMKMTLEDRMKMYQELMNCRKVIVESGILRKPENAQMQENKGFMKSTLRRLNKNKLDKMVKQEGGFAADFEADCFTLYPHSFWAFSRHPITSSLLITADPELERTALQSFNSILKYSGLLSNDSSSSSSPTNSASTDSSSTSSPVLNALTTELNQIQLAQLIIHRAMHKNASELFRNELFLQLIKQTTDNPEPNSKVNIKNWQLLALACSVTYPTDRKILALLNAHLRKTATDEHTVEGQWSIFTLRAFLGSVETKGRKYTPSRTEVRAILNKRRVLARIHFLDTQYQAVEVSLFSNQIISN